MKKIDSSERLLTRKQVAEYMGGYDKVNMNYGEGLYIEKRKLRFWNALDLKMEYSETLCDDKDSIKRREYVPIQEKSQYYDDFHNPYLPDEEREHLMEFIAMSSKWMEYTWFQDDQGMDIYENDILYARGLGYWEVVKNDNKFFCSRAISDTRQISKNEFRIFLQEMDLKESNRLLVVGNSFETPSLLNK